MSAPYVGRAMALLAALAALTAAAQEPFADTPPVRRLEARPLDGLRADVAALIVNGREGGALRAAVLAAPAVAGESDVSDASDVSDPSERRMSVDLWVEVDGARLLGEGEPPESLRLEVHAYAMTPAGALAGHLSRTFRLTLAEWGEALDASGVKLAGRLELAGGDYELRVLVRERRSQRFVLRIVPLTVPAPASSRPVVSPLLFSDPPGGWIQARDADDRGGESPAALPVLAAGRELTARLRVYGADGTPVDVRLLDLERRPLEELAVEISELPGGPPRLRQLALRFALPDLATGNYFLESSLAGAAGRSAALLPVYVLGAEWAEDERELVWTGIRRLSASPERRREALDLAAKRRASKRVKAIAAAYRGVLERLAEGSTAEAVAELRQLEIEATESDDTGARDWLESAQSQVIAGLVAHGADSLIPLLYLHMEVHDRHVDDDRTLLTLHARERVVDLARRYAAEAPSELAPSLAGSALADMGLSLQWARQLVSARRMLEDALALDPRHPVALLNLALHHERRSEYAQATEYLRRLLAIEPRSDEGRLRLALALRRLDEVGEAARLLRRVIDDGTTQWLLAVAYQELGRILLAQGRVAEAVRLLEGGVRRLPWASRLYVQLAYALDRHGDSRRGREVLASAPPAAGLSPRMRYSRRPQDEQRRGRPALARQAMARLAILGEALAHSKEGR